MSYLKFIFLSIMLCTVILAQAQVQEERVIIIEKDFEKNTEEIDIQIDPAKEKIEEGDILSLVESNEGVHTKMIIIGDDGQEKILEWDGNGEMPAEMKKHLNKHDLSKSNKKITKTEYHKMIVVDENGEKKTIEWDGRGEMPAEMKKMEDGNFEHTAGQKQVRVMKRVYDEDVIVNVEIDSDELPENVKEILEEEDIIIKTDQSKKKKEKPQLGVQIENHEEGIRITEIVENSAADEAGLMAGDIITGVEHLNLMTTSELINIISTYNVGDTIKISFIRNGTSESVKATLKKRIDNFPIKSWDTFMKESRQ